MPDNCSVVVASSSSEEGGFLAVDCYSHVEGKVVQSIVTGRVGEEKERPPSKLSLFKLTRFGLEASL